MADPEHRAVGYRGDGRGPFLEVARPGLSPEAREVGPGAGGSSGEGPAGAPQWGGRAERRGPCPAGGEPEGRLRGRGVPSGAPRSCLRRGCVCVCLRPSDPPS